MFRNANMASKESRFDDVLMGILSTDEKIVGYFEVMFNFLYRRTDFFQILKEPGGRLGFPPNVSKKLVLQAFNKYEAKAKRDEELVEKRLRETRCKAEKVKQPAEPQKVVDMEEVSPVVREEEVVSSQEASAAVCQDLRTSDVSCTDSGNNMVQREAVNNQSGQSDEPETRGNQSEGLQGINGQSVQSRKNAEGVQIKEESEANQKEVQTEKDEDSELTQQQRGFQAVPDSYNGADRGIFSWSQSINDVDVRIKVAPEVVKGRQVRVNVQKRHLSASMCDAAGQWQSLVDGELCWDVRTEETVWSLVPKEHIHVNLEKLQERWWDAVFTTEPKISVRKIDASRPITDLDDEAQTKIGEMMWNEDRKRRGLPTSEQMKNYELLRKAWDAPGSPFAGQPFDPSQVNIQGNSGGYMPSQPPPGT